VTTTFTPVQQIPALDRREAAVLAAAENERFVEVARGLSGGDWSKPTDCPAWDVRAMASHVLGVMDANASPRVFVHQFRAGKKAAGDRPDIDGMTEVQVRERAHLDPAQLVDRLTLMAPKAARGRKRVPSLLRNAPMKVEVAKVMETWRLGYLLDTILTRDTWMHRVDISRATGREPVLTPEHDGRIVADVVAEWARRHGRPFTLELTGVAGGAFTSGPSTSGHSTRGTETNDVSSESIALDAVEFCRILSGRATGAGLLNQEVPF
jgi:uncharacterized protein (TIGR03083 family)